MIFRKNKKVDVSVDTLKLRIAMIECLLEHKFTWKEINRGLGFSIPWYIFTNQLIEKKSK